MCCIWHCNPKKNHKWDLFKITVVSLRHQLNKINFKLRLPILRFFSWEKESYILTMPEKDLTRYHNLQSNFGDCSHAVICAMLSTLLLLLHINNCLSRVCFYFLIMQRNITQNSTMSPELWKFPSRISFG